MDATESFKYATQDYYFPNSLIRPNKKNHDMFINYGRVSSVLLQSEAGQPVLNQNNHFNDNQLSSRHPTLPISSTALQVDYPFKDRVMSENLSNIDKARYFVNYISRIRGAMLSKIPCNHLKPFKRIMEAVEEESCSIKSALKIRTSPTVKNYILDYTNLISANIENYNSDYVGGCLGVLNDERYNKTVCFPSGPHFDKLNICDLTVNEDDNNIYKYSNGIEINIGSGIYEIQSTTIRDIGYCGIRSQDNKCHMLRFQGENYSNTINTIETVNEKPTSIAVSPYIEGESLIATDSGTVHIWNVGKGLEGIILNKATRFHSNSKWRQVQYGACPQEIILADKTVVQIFDRRTDCERSYDLFTLPNKRLLNNERITLTSKHPSNPYQYLLATDYTLHLLDQRFPNHSVLYWDHLLESSPGLISVYNDQYNNDNSLVLLASHYPPETMCFRFQQSNNHPATSTQTPFRLSKISDICNYEIPMLNTYCILSKKRLETSLSGIAAISGADSNSILTLQLDCHGELFHQVYSSTNDNRNDPTCSAGPGFNTKNFNKDAQLHCKLWMSSLERHVGQVCEENDLLDVTTSDYSNRYQELLKTGAPSKWCVICKPGNNKSNNGNIEEICTSCQLSTTTSRSLLSAHQQDKFAIIDCGDGFKIFNEQIPPYDKLPHSTARSQILIKLWHEPDPDLTPLIIQADKDVKKYKERYEKAKRKLLEKSEKRRKYYTTLKKKGHDINAIYFEHKNNPKKLDKFVKSLASNYDENIQHDGSFITDTVTHTVTDSTSSVSKISRPDANRTLLARESQNLSLLQMLQSSSGSNSYTDQLSVLSDNSATHTALKSPAKKSRRNSISSQAMSNHPSSPTNSEKSLNCTPDAFKIPQFPALKKKKSGTPSTDDKGTEIAETGNKSSGIKRKRLEESDSDDSFSSSCTSDDVDLPEIPSTSTEKRVSPKLPSNKKKMNEKKKREPKQDTESNLTHVSNVNKEEVGSTPNAKQKESHDGSTKNTKKRKGGGEDLSSNDESTNQKDSHRGSTKSTRREKGKGDGDDSSLTDGNTAQKASRNRLESDVEDEYTFHSDSSLTSNYKKRSKRKSAHTPFEPSEHNTRKRNSVARIISDSSSDNEKSVLSPPQSVKSLRSRNLSTSSSQSNEKPNKHKKGRKKAKTVDNGGVTNTHLPPDNEIQTPISSNHYQTHVDPHKEIGSSFNDSESNESTHSRKKKKGRKRKGKTPEDLDTSTVEDSQTPEKTKSQLLNSENYHSDSSLFSSQQSVLSDVNLDDTIAQGPGMSKKKKKKKKKKKNKSCLDSSQDSNRENSDDNDFSNSPNNRTHLGSKTSTSKTEDKKSKDKGEKGKSAKDSQNRMNESSNVSDNLSQTDVKYKVELIESDCNSFCEVERPERLESVQLKQDLEDHHSDLSVDDIKQLDSVYGEDDDKSSVNLSVSDMDVSNISGYSGYRRSVKEEVPVPEEDHSFKIETDSESVKDVKYEVESINGTEFDVDCLKRELEDHVESDIGDSKLKNTMDDNETLPPSPSPSVTSDVVHIPGVCGHSIPPSPDTTVFSPITQISTLQDSNLGLENSNSSHKRNLFCDSVKLSALDQLAKDFVHNSVNSSINQGRVCSTGDSPSKCNDDTDYKSFKPEITSTQLNSTTLHKSSNKKPKKKKNFVIGF